MVTSFSPSLTFLISFYHSLHLLNIGKIASSWRREEVDQLRFGDRQGDWTAEHTGLPFWGDT